MKKLLAISSLVLLAALFLHACGIIPNPNTSFVTITIGDNQRATLHAEKATTWSRFKYFLAETKLMPEAQAYIPSVVQVIIVTVTAADITTPIVGVASIQPTDTSASIRIEVPNGDARQFLVEGIRGVDSQIYYRGSATKNLDGTDLNLPIIMALVGPGLHVNFATGIDSPATTGTSTNPFKTITYALTRTTGTDAIYVAAGTYPPAGAAAGESYPLQLHPATAILCTGPSFSSVLDLGSLATTAIYGNDQASIDNCKIRVSAAGGGGIAINDAIGGQPIQQSRLRVNGMFVELSGSLTGLANMGAVFSHDSLLLDSVVTGSAANGIFYGVQVLGGTPQIIGSTVSNLPGGVGINLASGAGNALITASTISGNSTGILVSAANPEITGNFINGNSIGIDVESGAGTPLIRSNSLYCNSIADFFTNVSASLDIRDNAWDHDLTTSPSGTFGPTNMISNNGPFGCGSGVDVCYQDTSPQPNFTRNNPAVPAPPACR